MRHIAVLKHKPKLSGRDSIPDGAINGNGDLSVILGNCENGMRIHLAKCDIWCEREVPGDKGLKPLGNIDIPISKSMYDNYFVEQDMDIAELRCHFKDDCDWLDIVVRVHKTDNSGVIEIDGNIPLPTPMLANRADATGNTDSFENGGISFISRKFTGGTTACDTFACCAMTQIESGRYFFCAATNFDVENPDDEVVKKAREMSAEKCRHLKEEHLNAWADFWSKSSFHISDEELELRWYGSQYLLAVCTGNKRFPPGLYGNFITVENPSWASDYHLNYNYQAPFYAACLTNHTEFTDAYHVPLEDFVERGRKDAARFGCKGIFFPVSIFPKGLYSELEPSSKYCFERLHLGQKSNAIHAADIMIFRWKYTRDTAYAREHAYPFLKEALEFFEDYATFENGRFSVERDATHEIPYYKENDFNERQYRRFINDKNNVLTLGLLRLGLEAGIDMAKALNVDEDKQEKWQYMLDHLASFPTCIRHFKRVYRYTEKGMRWNDSGDVGLQHIYPSGCVGLSSDEKTLRTARNTFKQNGRWLDGNACSSFFPCAARLGIEPELIVEKLKEHNKLKGLPNMLYYHGGGCLENCSIVPNTLGEMALQSHQNVLSFFPVWPKSLDCRFDNLRAYGGFLVSAEMKNGKIGYITVVSECGELLNFINPFERCAVVSDGGVRCFESKDISIPTEVGEKIVIKPD